MGPIRRDHSRLAGELMVIIALGALWLGASALVVTGLVRAAARLGTHDPEAAGTREASPSAA